MSTASKPTKSEVVSDFRRSQVLEAARTCFGRNGLAGTTMDGIARSAGVAKGTVYLYYKSKEDILRQLLDEDLSQFQSDLLPVISGAGTIQDKLRRFITATLTFVDLKRDFVEQVHFEMGPEVRKKSLQKLEGFFHAQVDSWQAALAEAQKARTVGRLDLRSTALTIVAVANGLAKQRLRGWTDGSVAEIAEQASSTLWKGIAAR